jgi:hypothetical protein
VPGAYQRHRGGRVVEPPLTRVEEIEDELEALFAARPLLLREAATHVLPQPERGPIQAVLSALSLRPERWAAQLVVGAEKTIVNLEHELTLWMVLEEVAPPEALALARKHWEPGDTQVAQVAYRVAEIAHQLEQLPEELREEVEAQRELSRNFDDEEYGLLDDEEDDDFEDEDDDLVLGKALDLGYVPMVEEPQTVVRTEPKVGRNDPCPCGSGKKYKKCHGG